MKRLAILFRYCFNCVGTIRWVPVFHTFQKFGQGSAAVRVRAKTHMALGSEPPPPAKTSPVFVLCGGWTRKSKVVDGRRSDTNSIRWGLRRHSLAYKSSRFRSWIDGNRKRAMEKISEGTVIAIASPLLSSPAIYLLNSVSTMREKQVLSGTTTTERVQNASFVRSTQSPAPCPARHQVR